ncbi:barstar family protein [Nocardia ignorata]|uniref:Barstar (Barnase inhibitor) n=1 Tax=Nocardia ignorata TaxID=145285 RepID=A0A4R6PNP3_NOCIG|nr:barstar family protein [Nocardia ignorata]TDP39910.1 barstar (barnase inhibitor) [Nocardia ignorata]
MPLTLSQFLARPPADAPAAADAPVLGAMAVDANQLSAIRYDAPADYRVRELRGTKMRDVTTLFDEFAAAFQFPYYFGANKDAFDECLRDLDDFVGDAPGYVAVVRTADDLLADEPTERAWFEAAMRDCAAYWSRRDVVFRVVLQGDPVTFGAVALVE